MNWKCQELSGSDVRVSIFRKFCNKVWMTDSHVGNWNRDFPKWKTLRQPMEGVCSCFDLTEVNVVLAPRLANRQPFNRQSHLWNVFLITFQNCEILLLCSSSPSPYQTASPKWKNYPDVWGDISKNILEISRFIYVWQQIVKMEYKEINVGLSFPPLLFPT